MAVKNSGLIFLVILLMVASLGLGGSGFYLLQQEKVKTTSLQTQLDELKSAKQKIEAELEDKKSKIGDLEQKLQDFSAQLSTLSDKLDKESLAKKDALDQIDRINDLLDKEKSERLDLEEKLSDASKQLRDTEDKLKVMEQQLKQAQEIKSGLEEKLKSVEETAEGVELGKIVVNEPQRKMLEPVSSKIDKTVKTADRNISKSYKTKEGKVLVVNKDYKFVVINLGSKDGVKLGDMFSIVHNGKAIGDVKVEKIHETMSAAGFVYPEAIAKAAEGDTAIRL